MISMNEYNIGYLDGRNHALELAARFVSSRMQEGAPERKDHAAKSVLQVLSDRKSLEQALRTFDPGFFNNYDETLGSVG